MKENGKVASWAELVDKDDASRPFFAIEGGAHEDEVLGQCAL